MADFKPVFEATKGFEGGFQNMASDTGNYCDGKLIGTKYGIAATGFKGYFGRCPSVEEIKNLSVQTAYEIGKKNYWDAIQGDKINSQKLAHLIFDSVYGGSSGFLHIRQALNKIANKNITSETSKWGLTNNEISAINNLDSTKLFNQLYEIRKKFFETHSQASIYGKGWTNRLNSIFNQYSVKIVEITKKYWLVLALGISALTVGIYLYKKK